MIATVSDDATLRIWSIEDRQLIKAKKLLKPARCCCFSPDGQAIAVGYKDGSFVVVQTKSLSDMANFHHRKEEISDIKFSPGKLPKLFKINC